MIRIILRLEVLLQQSHVFYPLDGICCNYQFSHFFVTPSHIDIITASKCLFHPSSQTRLTSWLGLTMMAVRVFFFPFVYYIQYR